MGEVRSIYGRSNPIKSIGFNRNLVAIFKQLFNFLTVSSIFIGITGFFQTFGGYILLGMTPSIPICISVFLMTFSVYSLNKLTDIEEDAINMPERISFLAGRTKLILYYSLAAYVLSAIIAFLEKPLVLPLIFIPLASNAIYSSRLIPGLPRLKDIPFMKNLTVAISWALVCTLLPAVHMNIASKGLIVIIILFMITKDVITTALYDIRDVVGDRENGVRTIPVIFGPKKTILLLLLLNSTMLPLLVFVEGEVRFLMATLILYGYVCIVYFRERRNPLVLDFFVDGEWMLACAFLYINILLYI